MNKTWIIIQREFINRVSKKSFILLTRPETGSHY